MRNRTSRDDDPVTWNRAIIAAVVTSVAATMPFFLTATLASRIRQDLGFGEAALGALLSVYALGGSVAAPSLGRVAERFGPRDSLRLAGAWAGAILILAAAVSQRWIHLAVLLVAAGLGHTLMQSAGNLWLARTVGRDRVGLAFGLTKSGAPIAALVAGIAVPAIAVPLGWRWTWTLVGVFCCASVFLVPDPGDTHGRGAQHRAERDFDVRPLIMMALGAGIGSAAAASLTGFAALGAIEQAGMTESTTGVLIAVGAVVGIAARVGLGWLADGRPRNLFAMSAAVAGSGAIGFVGLASGSATLFVIAVPVAFGTVWGWPGLFNHAITDAYASAPAAASGVAQTGTFAGVVIGPALFGLAVGTSYTLAWLAAALASVAAACAIVLGSRMLHRAGRPTSTEARGP